MRTRRCLIDMLLCTCVSYCDKVHWTLTLYAFDTPANNLIQRNKVTDLRFHDSARSLNHSCCCCCCCRRRREHVGHVHRRTLILILHALECTEGRRWSCYFAHCVLPAESISFEGIAGGTPPIPLAVRGKLFFIAMHVPRSLSHSRSRCGRSHAASSLERSKVEWIQDDALSVQSQVGSYGALERAVMTSVAHPNSVNPA